MKLIHCAPVVSSLLFTAAAWSADAPYFDGTVLTIPRVDTPGQVGKYQEGVMRRNPDGTWSILSLRSVEPYSELSNLYNNWRVQVVTTSVAAGPVSVYLRVRGADGGCPRHPVRVHQRRSGSEIAVSLTRDSTSSGVCPAMMYPYHLSVPLDVYGLPAGTYSFVINNEYRGTFALERDNKFPDDCDAWQNCPFVP